MITGGSGDQSKSVEIFRTDGTPLSSCAIPDLPDSRRSHTQIGTMICGGGNNETDTSCINLVSNVWEVVEFTLRYRRIWHVSWQSKMGLVLMGGLFSDATTELVTDEGSAEYFDLKHPVM